MARLVFLGRLEDVAGVPELACPLTEPTAFADLLLMLPPALAEALQAPKVRLALNGTVADAAQLVVADGDELAFLPPVSGG
ncbi:MAG TPA: MoaD/ThiS family protein [Novosphingobium sp.]|nr:MoaD/ThiS family protein [Novosphingobium sp.]